MLISFEWKTMTIGYEFFVVLKFLMFLIIFINTDGMAVR